MKWFWVRTLFLSAFFLNGSVSVFAMPRLGEEAYKYTQDILSFGPRSIWDRGHEELGLFLKKTFQSYGVALTSFSFKVETSMGTAHLTNYWAKIPKHSLKDPTIVFMAHYDSKHYKDFLFLGANDSASAVGLLLAMAQFYAQNTPQINLEFVFLDAEESLKSWSKQDSLYGSRWLSALWSREQRAKEDISIVLLDMIGDPHSRFCQEKGFSAPELVGKIWDIAEQMGYGQIFSSDCSSYIEDDHVPFSQKGFKTVDIIAYPFPKYWHTSEDTLDKVDPEMLSRVGEVLMMYVQLEESRK